MVDLLQNIASHSSCGMVPCTYSPTCHHPPVPTPFLGSGNGILFSISLDQCFNPHINKDMHYLGTGIILSEQSAGGLKDLPVDILTYRINHILKDKFGTQGVLSWTTLHTQIVHGPLLLLSKDQDSWGIISKAIYLQWWTRTVRGGLRCDPWPQCMNQKQSPLFRNSSPRGLYSVLVGSKFVFSVLFWFFVVLGIKPLTTCMLDKCSVTELYPQPHSVFEKCHQPAL
jgi:hypothetical protein